ncbi:MAG: hypothetical protein KA408_01330 [Flavobacteriales bacterium]|nr:hypothetical protein [Flavobacteriales bacterium]
MNEKENTNWFDELTEIFGWIQIMFSPTLVGLALGGLYYLYSPDTIGKILGSTIAIIGLIIGIIWATKVKKKYGTIWFISRNMATPELDTRNDSTENKKATKNTAANKG